ncbi:MAG: hypothetical protein K0Q72_5300, partial [Armatimonadetes bacterium]|nr:hypothetical protein [Armatimonadota bacterium]
MFLDNPFFLRETRQHARRPLPLQLGLLGLTGAFAFVLFMEQYLWNRFGRGNDPPDALIGFMVFPHFLVCAAAGAYGADRIFGEEHRRSTLEALFLIPISHGKWLAQRLAWPLYLVVTAWLTGVPAYLLAALLRIGSPDFNLQLSLIALSGGLVAMTLAMLLPPDYRERMRAARMAAGGRKRKVDVDLAFTWGIFSGLGILFQFSMISQIWRLRGPVSFYGTRLEIAPLLGAIALAVVGAAVAVSMATVSREDRWVRWSQRVRIGAVGVLYYGVSGLILGALWYRISFWVQWGVPILFPLAVWLLLRNQSRPKEDRLSVNE